MLFFFKNIFRRLSFSAFAGEKVKPEVNVHVTEEVKRTITDAAEQW